MSDPTGSGAVRFTSRGLGSTYNHAVITNVPPLLRPEQVTPLSLIVSVKNIEVPHAVALSAWKINALFRCWILEQHNHSQKIIIIRSHFCF